MINILDPMIIIPAVLSAVVIIKLIGVLGKRTGNEQPPNASRFRIFSASESSDNQHDIKPQDLAIVAQDDLDCEQGLTEVDLRLRELSKKDQYFSKTRFIEGAIMAYETIVNAFAKGDKTVLERLLSKTVYEGFCRVIDERLRLGQVLDFIIVSIDKADIIDVVVTDPSARIKVDFVSQAIYSTKDSDGKVVSGDQQKPEILNDRWTFERSISSSSPSWLVVSTEQVVSN